ncbi:MAG: DUF6596 domain-containing protein [Ferruginibacter sp.]
MQQPELIPHLFRTEYRKIVSVLYNLFGIEHIEIAEDIASDTFLLATELWGLKGLPENPVAWLYIVAKNKTKDYLKRNAHFAQKIAKDIKYSSSTEGVLEIDLSGKNISDSQLAMMFAVCHPCISTEAQIALSLHLLCGFGIEEISEAFLTNKEVIYKRISRAKEKLRTEKVKIEQPTLSAISDRLETVLTTLYLLFNEGYYSASQNKTINKELCVEAMRLTFSLIENERTNKPAVNALLSLMCFHSSRFEARTGLNGEIILYEDQDTNLWNQELIERGQYYLNLSSQGEQVTKYHLEAAIAYWHTNKFDSPEKWENILRHYNNLLQIEYSPIAALNRTYALAKAISSRHGAEENKSEQQGKRAAIVEAEKLNLAGNHLYHSLLGNLYSQLDNKKALQHFQTAYDLAKSSADKATIRINMDKLNMIKVDR